MQLICLSLVLLDAEHVCEVMQFTCKHNLVRIVPSEVLVKLAMGAGYSCLSITLVQQQSGLFNRPLR